VEPAAGIVRMYKKQLYLEIEKLVIRALSNPVIARARHGPLLCDLRFVRKRLVKPIEING
jgi:hypothetical protein